MGKGALGSTALEKVYLGSDQHPKDIEGKKMQKKCQLRKVGRLNKTSWQLVVTDQARKCEFWEGKHSTSVYLA